MKSQGVDDEEFNDVNSGDPRPLLEEGIYPALLVDVAKRVYAWGEKLVFTWAVFTTARFRDAEMKGSNVSLPRYYNAKRDKAKRFVFGDGHTYRKDWIAANNGKHPQPRNRLPPSVFRGRFLWVQITTVTKDARGPLHKSCHYSKVERVIGPVNEGENVERLPVQLEDIT